MRYLLYSVLLVSQIAFADVYKCKDASGTYIYTDQPCKGEVSTIQIESTKQAGSTSDAYLPEELDPSTINYQSKKPIRNSPQAAAMSLLLNVENGNSSAAEEYISKEVPQWLRESFLKRHSLEYGPLVMDSLTYQLVSIQDGVYEVAFTLNWQNGYHTSGRRDFVIEDGTWKAQ